jgi:hypothetical protein
MRDIEHCPVESGTDEFRAVPNQRRINFMSGAGASLSIAELKQRLADVPGIEGLTMQIAMGRQIFGLNGKLIGVDAGASDAEVERVIRAAIASDAVAEIIPPASPSAALLPPLIPEQPAKPKEVRMSSPAPGSFAASIRAMMDEARSGVAKAREEGLAKVSDAVSKLGEAKAATEHVAASMAKTIHDEADAVMAELGLISNDLHGESQKEG